MHRLFSTMIIALVALGCGSSASPAPAKTAADHKAAHDHGDHKGQDHSGHHDHRFENADEWAERFDDPGRDEWQKPDRVVELIGLSPGMTVADIGAGTGYFNAHLSKAVGAGGKVIALDVEADMVRYMKQRAEKDGLANVEARVVATDDPGLASASVDRILIVNTWHHIAARDAYGKKLLAALRPGGRVAIVDYTRDAPRGPPKKHRLPPEVVRDELTGAGFTATVLPEDLPLQYIVVGEKR